LPLAVLTGRLIHPGVLGALARAGHGSRILIADGNYPHGTARGPNADLVFLNLAPGLVTSTQVLEAILSAVSVEAVAVMATPEGAPEPPVWAEYRRLLGETGAPTDMAEIERFDFYRAAGGTDVALAVATGDERLYANVLLTLGVVET
jgi:L-fucose mutarotase